MSINNNDSQGSHRNMSKHSISKAKSQVETASSSSSDYSTCSDNPRTNMYWNKYKPRESIILAGQVVINRLEETSSDTVLEDSNFPINPLEVNVDSVLDVHVLSSENDIYSDCRNSITTDSHNDSTMYLELGSVFNSKASPSNLSNIDSSSSQMAHQPIPAPEHMPLLHCEGYPICRLSTSLAANAINLQCRNGNRDSSPVVGMLQERPLTIIEEREITNTTDHIVKDLSPLDSNHQTGQLVTEVLGQLEMHQEQNNNLKKVLFADLDKVEDNQNNKLQVEKAPNLSDVRAKWPRKVNDPCTNHNTTESFILWEKFCDASEKLASRRSFSFSELNAISESFSSDDEYSTSYNTLDDMYLSRSSMEIENNSKSYQHKGMGRSISCDSILREVKHLPHLLYDRFLKCLSREIERIRKENVVCTCPKLYAKNSNKENEGKKSSKKSTSKLTNKIITKKNVVTESRLPLQNKTYSGAINRELSPKLRNQTRLSPTAPHGMRLSPEAAKRTRLPPQPVDRTKLSPEAPSRALSQLQRSPRSPARTPPTPSKGRYFWNKQIVSPIGEYIRGKRPSPYQNSPNKKK